MQYDVHFCLISAQAAPNLLPILDPSCKPKEAVFIVSQSMKYQASYLEKVYKDKGVKVHTYPIEHEFEFNQLDDQIWTIISKYTDKNIALNVTGGTKLMSISAANAFISAEKDIFYVDTDNNRITFITKDKDNCWIEPYPLKTKINLDVYLSSYGMKIINKSKQEVDSDRLSAMDIVLKKYPKYLKVIPYLNNAASRSQQQDYKYQLENSDLNCQEFIDFLNDLDYREIIDYQQKTKTINFKNQEIKEFLNGGWLEDYVYDQIKSIDKVDNILCNVEVGNTSFKTKESQYNTKNKGNINEFDIAFIARNKLHIIECKTQTMDKKIGTKPEDILYKLETLKNYGGTMTKKCLISYFEVPKHIKNRAKSLNIRIIEGIGITRLKQHILDWISK